MKISKWGNSLAIRLPGAVVKSDDTEKADHAESMTNCSNHRNQPSLHGSYTNVLQKTRVWTTPYQINLQL